MKSFCCLPWRRIFLFLTTKQIFRLKLVNIFLSSLIIEESRENLIQPIYEIGVACRDFEQLIQTVCQYFEVENFNDQFHLMNLTYKFSNYMRVYTSVEKELIGLRKDYTDENIIWANSRMPSFSKRVGNEYRRVTARFYPILLLNQDDSCKNSSMKNEQRILCDESFWFLDGFIFLNPSQPYSAIQHNFETTTPKMNQRSNSLPTMKLCQNSRDFTVSVLHDSNILTNILSERSRHSKNNLQYKYYLSEQQSILNKEFMPNDNNKRKTLQNMVADLVQIEEDFDEKVARYFVPKGESFEIYLKKSVGFILESSNTVFKTVQINRNVLHESFHSKLVSSGSSMSGVVRFIEMILSSKDYTDLTDRISKQFNQLFSLYDLLTGKIEYFTKRIGLRYFTRRDQMLIIKKLYTILFNNPISNCIISGKQMLKTSKLDNLVSKLQGNNTSTNSIQDEHKLNNVQKLYKVCKKEQRKEIQLEPKLEFTAKFCNVSFDDFTMDSLRHVTISISLTGVFAQTQCITKVFFKRP
ncbi:predicted protein [Naegleria gruberi]|uniref:Predicted protein n=1 Tax=Naegleria gruberi TaxID=5762 RepID=D2V8Q5_NAEGR|nr:uncharacterized protein NAEGRDRAFT_47567 [Naegleria gruberi]EFC46844.1 predicted protein [Naegleria gruberi]|eukprot:XP_002679588.1 predicted protein [Naegleria gruberi strain NEG-M]